MLELEVEIHQGKNRWHSYHVFRYVSPVFTCLLGTCAMYFDHGVLGGGFKYYFFHPDPWGNDPI